MQTRSITKRKEESYLISPEKYRAIVNSFLRNKKMLDLCLITAKVSLIFPVNLTEIFNTVIVSQSPPPPPHSIEESDVLLLPILGKSFEKTNFASLNYFINMLTSGFIKGNAISTSINNP